MRTEHKQIGPNLLQIMRASRGEYDVVFDEENGGWYAETIVNSVTMRSKTYPCAQDAEFAIKRKNVVCDTPVNKA